MVINPLVDGDLIFFQTTNPIEDCPVCTACQHEAWTSAAAE
jgi:hypothetical protein